MDGWNGDAPVAKFSGSDYLTFPLEVHNASELSLFIVLKAENNSNRKTPLMKGSSTGSNDYTMIYSSNNDGTWTLVVMDVNSSVNKLPSEFRLHEAQINEVQIGYDGSNSLVNLMTNGESLMLESMSVNLVNETARDWVIGMDWDTDSLTDFYEGAIAEILIFDKDLTPQDSAKIRYYLSRKWGLEESVDSDSDGFIDDIEEDEGASPIDATDMPISDLSDIVDSQIGAASDLGDIESSLKLWLDASNVDSKSNATLSNNDEVPIWLDLSGNGHHARQLYLDYVPTYDNSAIVFNGVDDFYSLDSFKDELSTGYTIIKVFKATKSSGSQHTQVLFSMHTDTGDNRLRLGPASSNLNGFYYSDVVTSDFSPIQM